MERGEERGERERGVRERGERGFKASFKLTTTVDRHRRAVV